MKTAEVLLSGSVLDRQMTAAIEKAGWPIIHTIVE
jgi:hypothetical protein